MESEERPARRDRKDDMKITPRDRYGNESWNDGGKPTNMFRTRMRKGRKQKNSEIDQAKEPGENE